MKDKMCLICGNKFNGNRRQKYTCCKNCAKRYRILKRMFTSNIYNKISKLNKRIEKLENGNRRS